MMLDCEFIVRRAVTMCANKYGTRNSNIETPRKNAGRRWIRLAIVRLRAHGAEADAEILEALIR